MSLPEWVSWICVELDVLLMPVSSYTSVVAISVYYMLGGHGGRREDLWISPGSGFLCFISEFSAMKVAHLEAELAGIRFQLYLSCCYLWPM